MLTNFRFLWQPKWKISELCVMLKNWQLNDWHNTYQFSSLSLSYKASREHLMFSPCKDRVNEKMVIQDVVTEFHFSSWLKVYVTWLWLYSKVSISSLCCATEGRPAISVSGGICCAAEWWPAISEVHNTKQNNDYLNICKVCHLN